MTRFAFLICTVAMCLFSVGCCAPMIGPGCNTMGCNDCNGLGQNQIVGTPLGTLQQLKRTLVCGSGCGDTYIGEWISTPPDAVDPCYNDQFIGGATKCRPFCWQSGTILNSLRGGLLGGRYCTGDQSSAPCGCGTPSCGGVVHGGGQIISDGYIDGGYISQGVSAGSTYGCSTCSANSEVGAPTRIAGRIPVVDPASRRMDARVQQIRGGG